MSALLIHTSNHLFSKPVWSHKLEADDYGCRNEEIPRGLLRKVIGEGILWISRKEEACYKSLDEGLKPTIENTVYLLAVDTERRYTRG